MNAYEGLWMRVLPQLAHVLPRRHGLLRAVCGDEASGERRDEEALEEPVHQPGLACGQAEPVLPGAPADRLRPLEQLPVRDCVDVRSSGRYLITSLLATITYVACECGT